MKPELVVPTFHKGNSLLFGLGLAFWLDPIQFIQDLLAQYQDIVRVRLGHSQVYMVHSCHMAKHILQKTNHKYAGLPLVTRSIKSVSGENSFTSQGQCWAMFRKTLQPLMDNLHGFDKIMVQESHRMMSSWQSGTVISVARAMQDITFHGFAWSLLGDRLVYEASLKQDYISATHYISQRIENPFMLPLVVPTSGNIKIKDSVRRIHTHLDAIISKCLHSHKSHNDLWQQLLDLYYAGKSAELVVVRNQVKMLLFVFLGPPAKIITWTLYHLCKYPRVAARLYVEIDRLLAGTAPTTDDMLKLPYLQISTSQMATIPRHAYIPWGLGPRACVARQISMLQIKIVLNAIIQQYTFTYRHIQ